MLSPEIYDMKKDNQPDVFAHAAHTTTARVYMGDYADYS